MKIGKFSGPSYEIGLGYCNKEELQNYEDESYEFTQFSHDYGVSAYEGTLEIDGEDYDYDGLRENFKTYELGYISRASKYDGIIKYIKAKNKDAFSFVGFCQVQESEDSFEIKDEDFDTENLRFIVKHIEEELFGFDEEMITDIFYINDENLCKLYNKYYADKEEDLSIQNEDFEGEIDSFINSLSQEDFRKIFKDFLINTELGDNNYDDKIFYDAPLSDFKELEDYCNSKEYFENIFEDDDMTTQLNDFGNLIILADFVSENFKDKELAKKFYKKAIKKAVDSYEFRNLAESIAQNLDDKIWAEELREKAENC